MAESGDHHKMDVVSRGLLDEITKPGSSSRSRPGSKVSQFSDPRDSKSRLQQSSGNLEFLTPEEIMRQDFDLEIHDYGSGDSEYTDEDDTATGRTSEMFGIPEPLTDKQARQQRNAALQEEVEESEYLMSRQLTLFGSLGDEDEDVDSDEERSIIRDIRAEITNQVKEEMKDELALYQHKKDKLNKPEEEKEEEPLDPKIKEALLKMRKLDRILQRKIKKEKQVKKDRILLQRKLRAELESIQPEGGRAVMKEEKANTDKFLALALPPSHNAGVVLPEGYEEDDECPVTPVFPTQVLEESIEKERNRQANRQANAQDEDGDSRLGSGTSRSNTGSATSSRDSSASKKAKKNKDFIKRNIQLAADAGNAIAMTDDEKKRVEDLLGDLEALPEIPEEESDTASTVNPYQISVISGEGFLPEDGEMKRLQHIDSRLKELLPPEDFESIASSTPRTQISTPASQTTLFSRTGLLSDTDMDKLGERALKETKESRDLKGRLNDIEVELKELTNFVEQELECPKLSSDQLSELLDQCARTMSRATTETNSIAESSRTSLVSSRQSLYENPPKLADQVLQGLLADARRSMGIPEQITDGSHATDGADDVVLESISEDTMRELLKDTRTTSRAASRAAMHRHNNQESARGNQYNHQLDHNDNQYDMYNTAQDPRVERNQYDMYNTAEEPREERRPFLPEIDPRGTLSTQRTNSSFRLNNEQCPSRPTSGSSRLSAITVRNSFADGPSDSILDDSGPTPRPPSESRRPSSGSKSRTLSPIIKNSID